MSSGSEVHLTVTMALPLSRYVANMRTAANVTRHTQRLVQELAVALLVLEFWLLWLRVGGSCADESIRGGCCTLGGRQ